MIFAVAMMFIDQTIVALAIPTLQHDLQLSPTGSQWIVNGYLLSLSALFALGGRVADVFGHRRVVIIGTRSRSPCSRRCAAPPRPARSGRRGSSSSGCCRAPSAAFLFPAALAIVVATYEVGERGKYLAIFFSISGGLTAIGPIAGGYLTQWTWRSIFWINVPVAIIAVGADRDRQARHRSPPGADRLRAARCSCAPGWRSRCSACSRPAPGGGAAPPPGRAWSSASRCWSRSSAGSCGSTQPLVPMRLFANRGFAVDNASCSCSRSASCRCSSSPACTPRSRSARAASNAGLILLVFFGGFTIAAQWGGRILDRRGARPTVVLGCAVAAVGFYLWARSSTTCRSARSGPYLAIAGAGMGLTLGPVSTDALNRAAPARLRRGHRGDPDGPQLRRQPRAGRSSVRCWSPTTVSKVEQTLGGFGVPKRIADQVARAISGASTAPAGAARRHTSRARGDPRRAAWISPPPIKVVVTGMAAAMAVAFVVAVLRMPRGRPARRPNRWRGVAGSALRRRVEGVRPRAGALRGSRSGHVRAAWPHTARGRPSDRERRRLTA